MDAHNLDEDWNFKHHFHMRTISRNWDLTELLSPANPAYHAKNEPESKAQEENQESTDVLSMSALGSYDPFPLPKTMPGEWDMSEFMAL